MNPGSLGTEPTLDNSHDSNTSIQPDYLTRLMTPEMGTISVRLMTQFDDKAVSGVNETLAKHTRI